MCFGTTPKNKRTVLFYFFFYWDKIQSSMSIKVVFSENDGLGTVPKSSILKLRNGKLDEHNDTIRLQDWFFRNSK